MMRASFQDRLNESCIDTFIPCAAFGECVCAAYLVVRPMPRSLDDNVWFLQLTSPTMNTR